MFDYRLIEALAMVDQEGSFEKAAKTLFITQSAVSQRIKSLEESMGQVLVARTTPPKATFVGRKILKHYVQVKQLESDLIEDMGESEKQGFSSLSVGINADSLALWFLEAIESLMQEQNLLLEIRVADQEQTHQFLKDGEVIGCISSQQKPMQGCQVKYLGSMNYRMVATSIFAAHWFPDGLKIESIRRAPAVIYDRKDDLHNKFLRKAVGKEAGFIPAHYIPSVEKFAEVIIGGNGYGMMPDQQSLSLLQDGKLVELLPGCMVVVDLYWHSWSIKSKLLEQFTRELVMKAKSLITTH